MPGESRERRGAGVERKLGWPSLARAGIFIAGSGQGSDMRRLASASRDDIDSTDFIFM